MESALVADVITAEHRRARAAHSNTRSVITDEKLLERITMKLNEVFMERWRNKEEEVIQEQFFQQLQSIKRLPPILNSVRLVLERLFTAETKPENVDWLAARWQALKKSKPELKNMNYFVDIFRSYLEEQLQNNELAMDEQVNNGQEENLQGEEDEGTDDDEEEVDEALNYQEEDTYRATTTTFKKILKPGVQYDLLRNVIEEEQLITHKAVFGLQHVISLIMDMIVDGDLFQYYNETNNECQFLDLKELGISDVA